MRRHFLHIMLSTALLIITIYLPVKGQGWNVELVDSLFLHWDGAVSVAIQGYYAYVATGATGLCIVNIANQATPYETGYYETLGYAEGVAVSGNYAYVADGFYFEIFDCSQALPAADKPQAEFPADFRLYEPHPNPFNAQMTVEIDIPRQSEVSLTIYDLQGRLVKILSEGAFAPGSDRAKVESEARYDGKPALGRQVENIFRALKSTLQTRPIYHQNEDAIKGHVFCSFLALMLLKELQLRLQAKGYKLEWNDIKRDLEALVEVEIEDVGQIYNLRTNLLGVCGKVFQAAGVAIPPTIRIQE